MLKKSIIILIFISAPFGFEKKINAKEKIVKNKSISVRTQKLENFDLYETISLIGKCEKENNLSYTAKICGTVDFVRTTNNKSIKKGETIIIIDANLADSIKKEAEAAHALADFTHNANIKLYEENRLSREKFIQSQLTYEQANVAYNKALKSYGNMVIKAQSDGTIGVIKKQVGDEVREKDPLFDITSDSFVEVLVELPESFLTNGSLNNSMEVFTLDAKGKKINGKISEKSNSVSDHGTVSMKIIFQKEAHLIQGSFIEIHIIYNKHTALSIQEKFISKNNSGNFIYTIDENSKAKQEYIKLGTRTANMIEIIDSNLNPNDKIISEGLTKIYDGAEVTVLSE